MSVQLTRLDSRILCLVVWVLKHVLQQNSLWKRWGVANTNINTKLVSVPADLAEGGLVVESGAAVSVPTCPDLEVEGTVDPEVEKMMRTNWKQKPPSRVETHLSFSVPKIDARYSAIEISQTQNLQYVSCYVFSRLTNVSVH